MSRGRKWALMACCCLSVFIVGVDSTTVNVALPSIRHDFGTTTTTLQWIVSAYTLTLASFYLLAGSLGDRYGRRKALVDGLVVFGLGCLGGSIAPTDGFLIGARILQAVGGAALAPTAMAVLANAFTDPHDKAKAIAMWGSAGGLAGGFGPILGGLLLQVADWRSIYWINLPFIGLCLVLALVSVRESKAELVRRFDVVGQVAVVVALAPAIFALIESRRLGWDSPVVIVSGAVAIAAVLVLVLYERRRPDALIDPALVRQVRYTAAILSVTATFFVFAAFMFLATIYLQDVRGLTALQAALFTIPSSATSIIGARIGGSLTRRFGGRVPLVVASVGLVTSGLLMLTTADGAPFAVVLVGFVAVGVGYSVANTTVSVVGVTAAGADRAGTGAALLSVGRQVGQSLGVAICGGTVALATDATFARDSVMAWWIIVGVGVLAFALALLQRPSRALA
jgi:EmrB/QacA subfamily drug resistance transporter